MEFSEYSLEPLRDDQEFILYRGHAREAKGSSVLMLAPLSIRPALETLKKMKHECSFANDLDPRWAVRSLFLSEYNKKAVLILEDPGGQPLSSLINGSVEITECLRVAVGLSAALSHLHERNLIHKDLKPSNILAEFATGRVWLTGFGIASRLPRERQSPQPPEFIAGTLAYMAPEQTGRMNRSIDARSDLYAFGVTLYEMITGSLPFTASEPMELVHCHIARQAVPPHERSQKVPVPVSAIIMKLLAKAPEERYQTAAGLESDLRRCLAAWETRREINDFPLGEHDRPDRLLIPEKLYGRELEVVTLLAAFDRVVKSGTPELVLVSGYSGIGKSSVVNELHKVLVPLRGLFASGKFDQYKRDIPYDTLAQAFQSLVRSLLSKSESELAIWREAFHEALGTNGLLMLELVPELKLIIGEQPPVPDLPTQDAQRRFQLVFRRFIGVFARPEHPVALFLDDLQWLDAATLDLLEDLLTQPDVRHLMLLGAYRDNEVDPSHPLMRKLEIIRRAGATVKEIVLATLHSEDLEHLLADSLHCEVEHAAPLAQLVHAKTDGNPFFAIQFISALTEESLLTFDYGEGRWSWDVNSILAKGYTDNVVDLLVGKLNRLPFETQRALQLLACMGNSAEFDVLETVYQNSNHDIHGDLAAAVRVGLLFQTEHAYRFLHDRVQEAAYSLIPQEMRAKAHLRVGRLLAERTPSHEREEKIFEIVNQFNRATHLITSSDERRRVAEFNLIAAGRAKFSIAYASALSYLATGRVLMSEESWITDYELIFSLERMRAECELLTADMESAEKRLSMLAARAKSAHDLGRVTCLQLMLYTALERLDRGVEICLEYLGRGGTKWLAHPSGDDLQLEYDRVWSLLGDRKIEDLLDAPLVANPDILDDLEVLTEFLTTAVFFDLDLCALVVCRMVNLSLQHGNCDASCLAYLWFGMVVASRFGKHEDAVRFGQLGYDLLQNRGLKRYESRICLCFGSIVVPSSKHARHGRDLVRHAFNVAHQMGDFTYAAYSLTQVVMSLLVVGDQLAQAQIEAEKGIEFAKKARVGIGADLIASDLQLIRNLRGLTSEFGSFNDDKFDEIAFERHLASNPALKDAEFQYWTLKAEALFFVGDYASAADASLKVRQQQPLTIVHEPAIFHFYSALSHAASWDSSPPDKQKDHFEALRASHRQLIIWSENCPDNFEDRASLVSAEVARIEGRIVEAESFYEKAIRSAHANGFVHNEAVSYEVAARFYAARGFQTFADAYLHEARYCYQRWGADGKVAQLDHLYPHLKKEGLISTPTSTILAPAELLDLATVIKVSQAVAGEIVLEKLIDGLMRAVIEHAGAERCLLILPQGDELQIRAEATTSGEDVTVHLRSATDSTAALPESVVRYAMRTRETVILNDASSQNLFSADHYMVQRRPRSILTLPLINQGKLISILYLENYLTPRVFTPDRITVLKVLASQAAISFENARLYRDLESSERELREVIETIPSMAWSAGADGAAEFFNGRWLAYAGLTADQAQGWGWTVAVHPGDLSVLVNYWRTLMASGQSGEFEARLRRFDGVYRWFLFRATPSVDDNGTVVKWYGTNTDIEERKKAEQALKRSEAYLAEAQRLTHTGSCAMDGASRETMYWSEEMFRLFGFDQQQGLPMSSQWLQRVHPEDRDKVKLATDRTFLKKVDCDVEFRIVKLDGTVKHIHGIGHPVLSSNGDLVQVVGTMVDITERICSEEALKRSETYLAQAQRVAHIGSWVFNTVRMEPLHLSKEWHRLQGFDPKEGMPTWKQRLQRIHPMDRERYEQAFNRAIAEKSDLDAEFRILLPDSTVRYIRSLGHPVLDAFGDASQMMGVIMDVTESRQAEEERERLRQELAHLARLNRVSTIGELTASLAHEIKQPIGAAVTNAQACLRFLNDGQPDVSEAREAALEMTRDATRAADIIDSVRSLYRKNSPHQEIVDVNGVIREMVVMLQGEANRYSVEMRTGLGENLPDVVADRVQIQQVLMNLINNGIEAMRDAGGELSVKSQLAADGQLLISVSDTGVGLPSGKEAEIFNPFFTTKLQGTGLGLAITRSIVEAHGGRVWAGVNSGRGTTFYFTLPQKAAAHA